jgi:hypothetical protein
MVGGGFALGQSAPSPRVHSLQGLRWRR